MHRDFTPTRTAGLDHLAAFTPFMGRAYAAGRNYDRDASVSMLSPYVRRRLLLEGELVLAARRAHGEAAEKFVQEVFWRTYFKGFLEQHPSIWDAYQAGVRLGQDRLATEGGLRRVFHDATEGRSGIECFDAWARELVETNWLHNHVRMWFASIWIFTLRLPWELGAAFFLRHLLDGDPASNTLSWRWVAGLHTRGKAYVARAENIARYTEGRFDPRGQLDEAPEPIREDWTPVKVPLPRAGTLPACPVALLMHEEDCYPDLLDLGGAEVVSVAALRRSETGAADAVAAFATDAVADALGRLGKPCETLDAEGVGAWMARQSVPVVAAYAAVGDVATLLHPHDVLTVRRAWDSRAWPFATRGFFQLKDRIPRLIESLT